LKFVTTYGINEHKETGHMFSLKSVTAALKIKGSEREYEASFTIPFTIRAGQPNNSMVNLQANLLFTRAGFDSNPTGNSLAYDIKLWARPATDLALQLNPADFRLTRVYHLRADPREDYHFEHKARVRNLGVSSAPARNVNGKWEIYVCTRCPASDRWYLTRSGFFTIESVGSEWVEKTFSSRDGFTIDRGEVFRVPKDYLYQILLVVEVDPDNELGDTNRANNRIEYRFRVR
jgi:hypothetical protein